MGATSAAAGDTNGKDRTFKGENLLAGMHDSRVGGNGSPQDIVGFGQVNDDDLVLLADLFANTYEVVGLEGQALGEN